MGRSPCCDEIGLKKGPWTPEEDQKLIDHITSKGGHGSWRSLPKLAGINRCGKSCRLRWTNYLRPDIKRGNFSEEEESIIINLHSSLGNKWSKIATYLQGRTDNEIKNYWNTNLRKKLLKMGIDPRTHRPRADLNFLMNISKLLPGLGIDSLTRPENSESSSLLKLIHDATDATQLAKTQLLQSIFQVINTSPVPYYCSNAGPFGGLVLGNCSGSSYPRGSTDPLRELLLGAPSPNVVPELPVDSVAMSSSSTYTSSACEFIHQQERLGHNNNTLWDAKLGANWYDTLQAEEETLPSLVSASHPETAHLIMTKNDTNNSFEEMDGAWCSAFEACDSWEKFTNDERSGNFWDDIVD